MRISQLIDHLKSEQAKHGDLETTMQATLLDDGFSATNTPTMPDVFESTVESSTVLDEGKLGKRLRLHWQV